jgi:cytochrome c
MEVCAMSAWAENGAGRPLRRRRKRSSCRRLHAGAAAVLLALAFLPPTPAFSAPEGHDAAPALAAPAADGPGRPATPAEIAARDIDVRGPDGAGLPPGRGSVSEGEAVYAARCAACHGEFGEGVGRMPALIGGEETLATDRPRRTIGSFWPYAPTLFDYLRRAMPFGEAHSLSVNEIYALVAFLLEANGIVDADFEATPASLPDVRMPNRDGFVPDTRRRITAPRCFRNCLKTPPRIIAVAPPRPATEGGKERK